MRAPWRRGPSKAERLITVASLDNDTNQVRHGGVRYARVATGSGKVAHLMHPTQGVLCPDMRDWPADTWHPAAPSLPLHGRCAIAAGISGEEAKVLRHDGSESGVA